ncbi:hypothetical protein HUJ04_008749 [Dendroctonus ponderosae]|uniref:Leucine-rich repeat-containing protein 59 n=1 Tax=Dendroctonus ponderosae TaxID=77166 RepID=J3JYS2_DENPD|nr:unknown [Dendroctonus ponderosae]KAH1002684.1 hypothetical protein HUJ04_008749 [Dendroctonus ponderosae]
MVQKVKINIKSRISDDQLDLSMSDLDEVPIKEIAALRKIHSLDLSNNRLTSLPSAFASLTFLTKLHLSENGLTELPEDFGSLCKLRYLDLYKNKLERLPLSFSQLVGLKFLDLKDNPLIPTIAKVAGPCVDNKGCQQCAKDVVHFFKQLEQEVESRKQVRQKLLEINQQEKQAEKKRLKKERQSKTAIKEVQVVKNSTAAEVPQLVPANSKKPLEPLAGSAKSPLFSWFVYSIFLLLVLLWFLFSWRVSLAQSLAPKIGEVYENLLDQLPSNYRALAQSFGDSIIALQVGTRNISRQCADVVYNSEIVQTVLIKVYNLIGKNTS